MKNIIFVSDFTLDQYLGGAELDDVCLIENLKYNITFQTCHITNTLPINKNTLYIISNFIFLTEEKKQELIKNGTYIIYEKDFKLCKSRIPDKYNLPSPQLPKSELINIDFYNNAKYVICLTNYHASYYEYNLNCNVINIHGVLFSDNELNLIYKYINSPKNDKAYIFYPKSGNNLSMEIANKNNIKFDIINKLPREEFLKTISQYSYNIFITNITESCSRQCIENRIFNTEIICS